MDPWFSACRPLYKAVAAASEYFGARTILVLYINLFRQTDRLLSKGLDQSQIVSGQAVLGLKPADLLTSVFYCDDAKKVIFAYFGWVRFLQRLASTHLDHPGRSCAPSSPGPEGQVPIAAAPSRPAVLGGGSWLRRPPEVPAAGRWWPLSPRSHVVVPTEGFWGPGQ